MDVRLVHVEIQNQIWKGTHNHSSAGDSKSNASDTVKIARDSDIRPRRGQLPKMSGPKGRRRVTV